MGSNTEVCIFCGKTREMQGECVKRVGHAFKKTRSDLSGDKIGVPIERVIRKASNQVRFDG